MYNKPLSYSSIEKYDKCPFAWYDNFVLGNKPPERATSNRGIDYHQTLEDFFRGGGAYPCQDRVLRPWQSFMEGLAKKPNTPEGMVAVREDWTQCGFFDKDVWYRGKYDLKVNDDPRILDIFDWKSGKIYPEHESQGLSYCAMEPGDYDGYRTHFVYLDVPTHVETRQYAADKIVTERVKLSNKINLIRTATVFPPKPGHQCNYCHLSYKKGGKCRAAR